LEIDWKNLNLWTSLDEDQTYLVLNGLPVPVDQSFDAIQSLAEDMDIYFSVFTQRVETTPDYKVKERLVGVNLYSPEMIVVSEVRERDIKEELAEEIEAEKQKAVPNNQVMEQVKKEIADDLEVNLLGNVNKPKIKLEAK